MFDLRSVWWASSLLILSATVAVSQDPVPRVAPRAGAIVSAKGGEELQFPREPQWRPAIVRQDLVGGDTLRTGEIGTLGISFTDQTTIRVGRQSTLVVNEIAAASHGRTELELPSGTVWARASRGGSGVTVKTPAASAAIRGTDWSLSVEGDRTSILVMEGVVEFSNPQGSVTVRQGEGASARIGERPTKIVLVRSEDREQMLFYVELRGLFRGLPTTELEGAARRAERMRLAAIPRAQRTAEDWIRIAENGFGQDPRQVVLDAVAQARWLLGLGEGPAGVGERSAAPLAARRRASPSSTLRARLHLTEAMLAGSAKRYDEAAKLFAKAARGTAGRQRLTAHCGYFAAATLANPKRTLPMPKPGSPDQDVCSAYVTGFAKGLKEAEAILRQTRQKAPGHLLTSLVSAQVSLLLDRRDDMRATVERMRQLNPDAPETLLASGYLKSAIDSDVDGAVADFSRGTEIAPGDASLWNGLGLAQSARDAALEAEAAFRRGIEADPDDPVSYANLAVLLLDQSRVDEAGELIDKALALDPSLYAAYTAKGRYFLQKGDMAKALEYMLAGTAANPASAQGLLATAIVQYQAGDIQVATQALDNADRLDRNDPVTAISRTAIAVDQLDADAAISNAREAVRRYRNRGGYFAALASTRTGGSYLGQSYRLLNLEEWGRFYTDRVSDPFSATSYFDQAVARRARPFFTRPTLDQLNGNDFGDSAGSLVIQGLLLDPLAAAGRLGRIDLLRRPFLDAEIGGGIVRRNGRNGWQSEISVQAFSNSPIPTAVSLSASKIQTSDRRSAAAGGEAARSASAFIGMAPTASDRFLLWGTGQNSDPDVLAPAINLADADRRIVKSYQVGAGWSHTFAYRHVLTGAVSASRTNQSERRTQTIGVLDPFFEFFPALLETNRRRDVRVDSVTAALSHAIGIGDFTLRSGVETQSGRIRGFSQTGETLTIPDVPVTFTDAAEDPVRSRFTAGRVYANLQWQPSDILQIEAGVQGLRYDTDAQGQKVYGDPRIGIAFSPLSGQWLRASWRRDTELPTGLTLSPVTTVGLSPDPLPLQLTGRKETMAVRWDSEWSPYVFTSMEYQSQNADALRITIPDTLDGYDTGRARMNSISGSANLWLTHGIGLFTAARFTTSRTDGPAGTDVDVPFVPRRTFRAGLTFVHPSRIKLSILETYIGERFDSPGGVKLEGAWTTDLAASYETEDRRLLVGLSLLNAFDTRYQQVAARPGSEAIMGTGRTIAGSLKVRF